MSFQTNAYAGNCDCCGGRVAPRAGRLYKGPRRWIVRHADCAARRALPAPPVQAHLAVWANPAPLASPVGMTFDVWARIGPNWLRQNAHPRTHESATRLARDCRHDGQWDAIEVVPAGTAPANMAANRPHVYRAR